MYPFYRCMDSYPQMKNQMPYAPHYHPSLESIPHPMKGDSVRSVTYESWPYGGNCGYPYPVECHGCCNHNYFPTSYSFRPPYPHFTPPPTLHCHESYPVFQGANPLHYNHPPHYSMEQPRYGYEKIAPQDYHCCGCPNHSHAWKEDRNVKIEEQDPDVEKKTSDSLVPFELKNYPYPVFWIPPGYMKNKEDVKPIESDSKEGDKYHSDTKADRGSSSFEQEPSVWNKWLPLDMRSLDSLKQGGDGRGTQYQQNEDKSQLPFPIFRMPFKPEELERTDLKESDAGREFVNKLPSNFRITPANLLDSRASKENSGSDDGLKMMDKNVVQRVIPEELEKGEEKKSLKDMEGKSRDIPVVFTDGNGERKPSENSAKRQPSSPGKASKLPPVCLRVDPLPRRKCGTNSSRSSSAPANKGKAQEATNENSKSSSSSNTKEYSEQKMQSPKHVDKSKEVEHKKSKTKTIEVVEAMPMKDENEDLNMARTHSHEEVPSSQTTTQGGKGIEECIVKEDKGGSDTKVAKAQKATVEGQSGDDKCEIGEDRGASNAKEDKDDNEANKTERKKLPYAEAAVIIQSAYRGFALRKWEPLKKLKKIAEVKEQVADVRSQIQSLDSSSDILTDDKQKVVIGETIMSLLLNLDTIQGLHPCIRDTRKSVARELVSLQEKLDNKPKASIEESSAAKHVEDLSRNARDYVSIQEHEAAKVGLDSDLSVTGHDINSSIIDPCPGQPLPMTDAVSGTEAVETSELKVDKEVRGNFEDESTEVAYGVDSNKQDYLLPMEPKDERKDEERKEKVLDIGQVPIWETQEKHENLELEQSLELPLPLVAVQKTNSGANSMETDGEMNELVELSKGVVEEIFDAQKYEKNDQTNIGKEAIPQAEFIVETEAVPPVPPEYGVADMSHVEQPLEELLKETAVSAEPKGKFGSEQEEEISVLLKEDRLRPEEPLAEAQGKEVGHTNDSVVVDSFGSEKDEELPQTSETEERQPDFPFVEKEVCGGEFKESHGDDHSLVFKDTKEGQEGLEEEKFEFQKLQQVTGNDNHTNDSVVVDSFGSEKDEELPETSETEEPQPDFPFAEKEVCGVEFKESHGGDHSLVFKDTKEGQEGLEEEEKFEFQKLQQVTGNDNHTNDSVVVDSFGSEKDEELPQTSETEDPQPDFRFAEKEVCGGEFEESHGDDHSMVFKDTKEGQEGLEEKKFETQKLQQVTGNDNHTCDSSETIEKGVTEFVPVGAMQAEEVSSLSATASHISLESSMKRESERMLIQENGRLREMVESLIESGRQQLTAISDLSDRVKDLEKKLLRKRKMKMRRHGAPRVKPLPYYTIA